MNGNTSLSDYLASVTYGSRSRLGMELEPAAAAGATPAVFPDRDSKSDCSADAMVRPRPRATSTLHSHGDPAGDPPGRPGLLPGPPAGPVAPGFMLALTGRHHGRRPRCAPAARRTRCSTPLATAESPGGCCCPPPLRRACGAAPAPTWAMSGTCLVRDSDSGGLPVGRAGRFDASSPPALDSDAGIIQVV
jgi:hypothetical protein